MIEIVGLIALYGYCFYKDATTEGNWKETSYKEIKRKAIYKNKLRFKNEINY